MATLIALDSQPRPPGPRRNAATAIVTAQRPPSSVDLRHAYAFARALPEVGGERRHGHRLVWVRRGAVGSQRLPAADGAYAIVGRHTRCDVVLADDSFVALRHLLVRSVVSPSGALALRVLDLKTQLGFALPDGTRHTSIFAEGPVAIAVGDYALVALPAGGGGLPIELPRLEVREAPADALGAPYRRNARPTSNHVSRITLLPRPVMVGEPLLARAGAYALTLEREGRAATVALSEEDLARGVIVGRSDKCAFEPLRRITDVNTSRAHVLVSSEGPLVHAYDLASTQGTYAGGLPARRIVLPEEGARLALGRGAGAVRLVFGRVRTFTSSRRP